MLIQIAASKYKSQIHFYDNMEFICNRYIDHRYNTSYSPASLDDMVNSCYTAHLFGAGKEKLTVDKFNSTLIGSAYLQRLRSLNKTDFYTD